MRDILPFLLDHGYSILFGVVLAEQAGAPLPAVPVLLGIGALAGMERMSVGAAITLTVFAALLSDSFWYWLGRTRGGSILQLLCAISLEPDSCVGSTKNTFARMGPYSLLIAKFVPGLSTAAPPMAGVNRMPFARFVTYDAIGSALWGGSFLLLGYLFHHQIEVVAETAKAYGLRAGFTIALLLLAWMSFKLWKRERFIRSLRVARVAPHEAWSLLQSDTPPALLDLRHQPELVNGLLPGALWYDRATFDQYHQEVPRDRDVILYCS